MKELIEVATALTGADVSISAGGCLLVFIVGLVLPRKYKPWYLRPYVQRLEREIEDLKQLNLRLANRD